ncbi:ribonuclease E inhibitor RraB [Thorsellia kenyensis]|uniref:Ribonuclease E inhibitor RraB n=1 Tax=Thorsellia kenyensis TaxID=1549888 RepID=A0ABV6CCF9_9GAMM
MAITYPELNKENQLRFTELKKETAQIIQNLLDDGSLPDVDYLIEHHFYSADAALLEKMACHAIQVDLHVTEEEEFEDEETGELLFTCDIIFEIPLDGNIINDQIKLMLQMSQHFNVEYDGWGTYFEDGSEELEEI